MRLGRVQLANGYVVDLDDVEMVEDAIDILYEDISKMVIGNPDEFKHMIEYVEDDRLTKADIPEFLKEEEV